MGSLRLQLPNPGVEGDSAKIMIVADGSPRLQEGLVATPEGFGFGPELGLDVKGRLVQGARLAPAYPACGRGAGRLGVGDR